MFFFIRQKHATLKLSFWLLPPPAEKHDLNHNYQSSSFQHALPLDNPPKKQQLVAF